METYFYFIDNKEMETYGNQLIKQMKTQTTNL